MKLFFAAALAQVVATGIVIVSARAYWLLYGKEAWPVAIPSLLIALVAAEGGIIYAVFRNQTAVAFFLKVTPAILASWFGGVISFLAMDPIAKSLYFQTPKIAWVIALLIILLLARRFDTT